jgi:hypothetical protein
MQHQTSYTVNYKYYSIMVRGVRSELKNACQIVEAQSVDEAIANCNFQSYRYGYLVTSVTSNNISMHFPDSGFTIADKENKTVYTPSRTLENLVFSFLLLVMLVQSIKSVVLPYYSFTLQLQQDQKQLTQQSTTTPNSDSIALIHKSITKTQSQIEYLKVGVAVYGLILCGIIGMKFLMNKRRKSSKCI